jgi:di/tricarboxylate transporter
MQRFTNEANVPLAVTGLVILVAGIVGVFVVVAGYRSETLLDTSCAGIFFGILAAIAGSRWR